MSGHLDSVLAIKAVEELRWPDLYRRLREGRDPLAMATAPAFSATPAFGSAAVSATADTSYTAPVNAVNVLTAGANGTKVDEIVLIGTGTTVAGTITLFLFDGTSYHLYDCVTVPANNASTTSAPWRFPKPYADLVLPNGWSLRAASTVANQPVNVSASGGHY